MHSCPGCGSCTMYNSGASRSDRPRAIPAELIPYNARGAFMTKDAVPVFRCRAEPGHLPEVAGDPRRVTARKRVHTIQVQFAAVPSTLQTHEGSVHVSPGDAIMTGIGGEHWRVSHDRF